MTILRRIATAAFRAATPLIPPLVADRTRLQFSEFRYLGRSWPAGEGAPGWADASIARVQESRWPALARNLAGPGPLGVSHLPGHDTREDHADHNIMMSFAYVLGLVARGREEVSVLDWGGGCGHYFMYARTLFPGLPLRYHCYDLPLLCEAGRRLLPEATFHDDLSSLEGLTFDLVIASSSLHYFEDWRGALRRLARLGCGAVYVARLQTVVECASFVALQRPHGAGYLTEYPSWFLNVGELLAAAHEAGLRLEREFVFDERWHVRGAPERGESRGFLFRPIQEPARRH